MLWRHILRGNQAREHPREEDDEGLGALYLND